MREEYGYKAFGRRSRRRVPFGIKKQSVAAGRTVCGTTGGRTSAGASSGTLLSPCCSSRAEPHNSQRDVQTRRRFHALERGVRYPRVL